VEERADVQACDGGVSILVDTERDEEDHIRLAQ
jgi:hypothetical protein